MMNSYFYFTIGSNFAGSIVPLLRQGRLLNYVLAWSTLPDTQIGLSFHELPFFHMLTK